MWMHDSKTTLKTKKESCCFTKFCLATKMLRQKMMCYQSFRPNNKNKFEDKDKALSLRKKGNQMKSKFKKAKLKNFQKIFFKSNQKVFFKGKLSKILTPMIDKQATKHFCELTPFK